jgi:hypothetical protein
LMSCITYHREAYTSVVKWIYSEICCSFSHRTYQSSVLQTYTLYNVIWIIFLNYFSFDRIVNNVE